MGENKLEAVAWFCYLGDALSAGGGCELGTRIRVKCGWKKFLNSSLYSVPVVSLKTRGRGFSTCVRSVMLYGSETWALTKVDLQRLQRNDRVMIRQVC